MNQKNYTEVLIDGKIYTLGGVEEELYLQKVAAYLNEKIGKLKKQEGFGRMSADYQFVMEALNLADDYFKEQERADFLAEQKAAMEKDTYSLKHELITSQMKLEAVQKELAGEKKRRQELEKEVSTKNQDIQKEVDARCREIQEAAEVRCREAQEAADARCQEIQEAADAKCRAAQEAADARCQAAREAADARYQELKKEADAMKAEVQKFRALQSAAAAASQNHR